MFGERGGVNALAFFDFSLNLARGSQFWRGESVMLQHIKMFNMKPVLGDLPFFPQHSPAHLTVESLPYNVPDQLKGVRLLLAEDETCMWVDLQERAE